MTIRAFGVYHSLDDSLLHEDPVLDVGCRDFGFAEELAARGNRVIALDPDPAVEDPRRPGIEFYRVALVGVSGRAPGDVVRRKLVMHENPEAQYDLASGAAQTPGIVWPEIPVAGLTLAGLGHRLGVWFWEVVKLNCEGGETEILEYWPGPVARQVVVSFHEHFRPIGLERIEELMRRMDTWYVRAQHVRDERYGGGMNYWDTLLTVKPVFDPRNAPNIFIQNAGRL